MRSITTPLLALAATVAVTVTLTGCGSQDETKTESLSLEEKFGLPDYRDPDVMDSYAEEQALVEDAIASCMVDKGFEYKPVIYDQGSDVEYTEEDALESARLYGLGISLQFNNPELDAENEARSDEFVDPNQEYVEALGESEAQAYYEALDGTPEEMAQYETTEVDPESGETYTTIDGAGAGCRGDAQRAVGTAADQGVYDAMQPFQTEIGERVEADERIVAAKADWTACMSEKGFEYENQEALYEYASGPLTQRLTEVLGADPNGDPMADMTPAEQEAFYADKSEEEIQAFFEGFQDRLLENADLAALSALQDEERALAVASAECSSTSNELYEEVYDDVQTTYMAENADRIAAAVAELEQEPAPSSS